MTAIARRWALILHGGAKEIAPAEQDANRHGVLQALASGRTILSNGGSALDAVEAAVRVLEMLPAFNAGNGSSRNAAGQVEMDASIMDGATLDIGAVAGLQGVDHPISIARRLLREDEILLVGEGARQFARQEGADFEQTSATPLPAARLVEIRECDTVGCIAIDATGNLGVALSTGGLSGVKPGRVADTPMPGCGFYADNRRGAVALSGHGEEIARLTMASQVTGMIVAAGPETALRRAISEMPRLGGDAGGIAMDPQGRIGWWHNSPHFPVALQTSDMPDASAWLGKHEVRT